MSAESPIMLGAAVAAVQAQQAALMTRLDGEAMAARAAHIAALRAALRGLVPADDPMRPVAELLASTVIVGRADGYPEQCLPEQAEKVYAAAVRALGHTTMPPREARVGGLLDILSMYPSPGDWCNPYPDLGRLCVAERDADANAWRAAKDARKAHISLAG